MATGRAIETSLSAQLNWARAHVMGKRTFPLPKAGRSTPKDLLDRLTVGICGQFRSFSIAESTQLSALRQLVTQYVGHPSPSRPLCWALFGPPGCGKSFAVKQLKNVLERELNGSSGGKASSGTSVERPLKLPMTTINLTQLSEANDLASVLARIAGEQDNDTVPIVFFDEFDAARNAASYGWLSWFLAPMNDGELLHEGALFRLRRAIYFFAGGTAATMDEFAANSKADTFRFAKGPDFVSRLHGYLNVEGPNTEPHMLLKRALILRNEFDEQTKGRAKTVKIKPSTLLVDAMLRVGRYRHGGRSIKAVVETSDLQKATLDFKHLADDHVLKLHADRGPLDRDAIGGCIVLSGYEEVGGRSLPKKWKSVATEFWQQGATLAYGGRWENKLKSGESLMKALADAARKLPPALRRNSDPRPRLICFHKNANRRKTLVRDIQFEVPSRLSQHESRRLGKQFTNVSKLSWIETVLLQFRNRLHMTELSVARFAIMGSKQEFPGRFPGIAEEVMLSIALHKPVYVSGGFGGSAEDVGTLLGLARPWTGEPLSSFETGKQQQEVTKMLLQVNNMLRPPSLQTLPITMDDLATFLQEHAIGGDKWPDNGLTIDENRALFRSKDTKEIAGLVIKGLRKKFVDK